MVRSRASAPSCISIGSVEGSTVSPPRKTIVRIEASGAPQVIPAILRHAASEARVAVVALHDREIPVPFLLVMMKQLTIRGAMEYPADFGASLELLTRRDLRPMISHTFPLERFHEGLACARDPNAGGKVMIRPA